MTPHNLSSAEIESLKSCSASGDFEPAPGTRTAYIRRRLKELGLVQPLWVSDDQNDEFFFTWQRTPKGEELLNSL